MIVPLLAKVGLPTDRRVLPNRLPIPLRFPRFPLVAFLLLSFTGCATVSLRQVQVDARRDPGAAALIQDVPFYPQRLDECGPAALAMLAAHWGTNLAPAEISRAIYLPQIRGTLTFEMAAYAARYGFWTRQYRGSLDDLRRKIMAKTPVLVLGKLPGPAREQYHYWIVTGYDGDRRVLVTHSGARPNEVISWQRFERMWRGTGHWSLLVCPPEAVRWTMSADERLDLGLYFERRGDLERAALEYRAGLELAPTNAWLHFNLGNVLLAQKQFGEAVDRYRRALALDDRNPEVCNNLADALAELDDHLDQAEQLARRAVELDAAHPAAYLDTLGFVYLRQGKRDLARQTLERALAAATDRQPALRATIRRRLDTLAAEGK